MTTNIQHTADADLRVLVFGEEDSQEFRKAAAHVETCEFCQTRLSQLAGDDTQLDEIGSLLSGYSTDECEHADRTSVSGAASLTESSLRDILAPPSHPELLGRLGRYDIERVIGSGGMGVVVKGFDSDLNRPVAIKLLGRHLAHSGAARQRFARESRAAAAVVHEHVVSIHNVESEEETPFLVMQYVAGESLQTRVDRDGPLDVKEVLRIGIQAAAGLAAAHEQGVIHRDVKPANILLENGVERTLITDFGLARTVDDASLTHTGVIAGTPHYMSPEQANGGRSDHRSDLFSLGSVLYFMATGRPPFRAERAMGVLNRICHDTHRPVWQVNPDVPDDLSRIIDRLLSKSSQKRFDSAPETREALTRVLAGIQNRGGRPAIRLRRMVYRHPGRLVAVAAVLITGVTAFALWRPSAETSAKSSESQSTASVTSSEAARGAVPMPGSPEPAASTSEVSTTQLSAEQLESLNVGIAEWNSTGQEVDQRLLILESQFDESAFFSGSDDDFYRQVREIDLRLTDIQSGSGQTEPVDQQQQN